MEQTTKRPDSGNDFISGLIGLSAGIFIGSKLDKSKEVDPPGGGHTTVINIDNVYPDLWSSIFQDAGMSKDEYINFGIYCYIQRPVLDLIHRLDNDYNYYDSDQKKKVIKDFLQRWQCRQMGLPIAPSIAGFHAIFEPSNDGRDGSICIIDNLIVPNEGTFLVQDYPGSELLERAYLLCPQRNKDRQFLLHERQVACVNSDFRALFDLYKEEFNENNSFKIRQFAAATALSFGNGGIVAEVRAKLFLELFQRFNLFFDKSGKGCYLYALRDPAYAKFSDLLDTASDLLLD